MNGVADTLIRQVTGILTATSPAASAIVRFTTVSSRGRVMAGSSIASTPAPERISAIRVRSRNVSGASRPAAHTASVLSETVTSLTFCCFILFSLPGHTN